MESLESFRAKLGWQIAGLALAGLASACSADAGEGGSSQPEDQAEQAAVGDVFTPQRPVFAGVWNPSTSGQYLRLNRTYDGFVEEYGRLWGENFRLVSLTSNVVNGTILHSGVWNPSSSGQFVGLERTDSQFIEEYGTWWEKGFRLIAMTSVVVNGRVYYSGVWNPSTSGQFLGIGRTDAQFLAEYGTWWDKGFRLIALTSNVVNGQVLYNGVWNPSTSNQFLGIGRTEANFVAENQTWQSRGFRLIAFSTHVVNGVVYYNGVWNPGTHAQVLSVNRPESEFLTDYGTQWGAGMRLAALGTDHVEALALNRVATNITNAMNGKAVGFAATVAHGSSRARASGGLRRTSADSPARAASTSARMNVASVSKTVTATATLQLLRAKGLTPSSRISGYLPSDWTRGANVTRITFGELLSHTSGFRGANANATGYADLKTMVANGINPADKVFSYQNQNFALLRVIIPYLNGFIETGVTDKDAATSKAYLAYLNSKVFSPAGVSTIAMKPVSEPTLCYPFPAGNIRGTHFGDWTLSGGGAGLQLSTDDLASFLVKLRDGTLLPASWNETMNSGNYGWQGASPVRGGSVYAHGGYLFMPTDNGNAEVNALILSFTDGTQIAVEVNSRTDGDPWTAAVDGYNNSWVPLQ